MKVHLLGTKFGTEDECERWLQRQEARREIEITSVSGPGAIWRNGKIVRDKYSVTIHGYKVDALWLMMHPEHKRKKLEYVKYRQAGGELAYEAWVALDDKYERGGA